MLSRWIRSWDGPLLLPILRAFARLRITPNMLSVASLACMCAAGLWIANGRALPAGLFLLASGIIDTLDGELARFTQRSTPFGAFVDSICDHCGDFLFSLGLVQLYEGSLLETALIFAALFGSMLGSQIRSRAGMVGIDTKDVGVATRCERVLVWILGLATGHLAAALWLQAALTNFSALQRLTHVVRRARISTAP